MKKSTISLKGLLFFAVVLSALLAGILFIVANLQSNLVLQLGAVCLLYVTAIAYCLLDLKYYIIHFMFLLMIGVFLFNRPIIYYLNNGILPIIQPKEVRDKLAKLKPTDVGRIH